MDFVRIQQAAVLAIVTTLFINLPASAQNIPTSIQQELDFALDQILLLKFHKTSSLHQEFFGKGTTGAVYADYLSRIEAFSFRQVEGTGTVAVVSRGLPTVYVTQNFVTRENQTWLDNASILIHEVRHISIGEGRFGHVKCPARAIDGTTLVGHASGTPLENLRACDGHHRGAYGHQVVWLGNIANFCSNCSREITKRASYLFEQLLKRIVRNPGAYRKIQQDMLEPPLN